MSKQVLTVGMATYKDFEGVWGTITDLQAHHPTVDIVVVDNTPEADDRVRAKTQAAGGQYFHRPDLTGTAAPRDAAVRLARTPWVMVVDCHVALHSGAVQSALDYIAKNPESNDIVQGPMIYDDGATAPTHWQPTTPPGWWGVWDTDPRAKDLNAEPFDIPSQGLGLFLVRRESWPGFHPLHRGFGGEEGYIQHKYRVRGNRSLCLPALRWWHRFRHMHTGGQGPPYKLSLADHVWNLLVTHREQGIDAVNAIHKDFGMRLDAHTWQSLLAESEVKQPFGKELTRKRMKLLGVWYSNNAAPEKILQGSLRTIRTAMDQAMRHEVRAYSSSWEPINGNPLPWIPASDRNGGHANIVKQVYQQIEMAEKSGYQWDAICFLEHDVFYPANYFDKVGDGFHNPSVNVVSNLDYIGLNQTGWLDVKERHEPMHQLTIRRDFALGNLRRAMADCERQGWAYLEPDHASDRSAWYRIQPNLSNMPSVHVNHEKRFTSHGEVCYNPIGKSVTHPYWGKAKDWWHGEIQEMTTGCGGCGLSAPVAKFETIEQWYNEARSNPSDCNEHIPTVKALAENCQHVTEFNIWGSQWLAGLMAGKPKKVVSVSPSDMANWNQAKRVAGEIDFMSRKLDPLQCEIEETDLLLTDTHHNANQLYAELSRHASKVRRYIVIHDTDIYGENGDGGGPGLMPAIRRFTQEFPEWTVVRHDKNNYGLTVLSRDERDKKRLPNKLKMAWNLTKAMTRHTLNGGTYLPLELAQERQAECFVCDRRNGSQCSECGCHLVRVPDDSPVKAGEPGKTFYPTEFCPLGKWHARPNDGVAMSSDEVRGMLDRADSPQS